MTESTYNDTVSKIAGLTNSELDQELEQAAVASEKAEIESPVAAPDAIQSARNSGVARWLTTLPSSSIATGMGTTLTCNRFRASCAIGQSN